MKLINETFFVFVFLAVSAGLSLVRAAGEPGAVDLRAETEAQFDALLQDIANLAHFEKVAAQTLHPSSLVTKEDRDPLDILLRRTRTLIEDLRRMPKMPDLKPLDAKLNALVAEATATPATDAPKRRELFQRAASLRRQIAFSNPLLDFDEILFITRHRATFNHMCDQYYGRNAAPGGGVFVLADPFGNQPKLRNLLAGATVESGRLKGKKLESGSFLSPELSFDATRLTFAYVECEGDRTHITHLDHANNGHWTQGQCYHLFSVDLENGQAARLRQVTDGTFNDFDPCYLPNGRVAFISERRGGYLRCGRDCPSYTVHDMNPDGSDIRLLSPHENNEWGPSMTHDGMIMYTRWDYVDRHGCVAHHPWVMTPDGRDSRAVHGNFSVRAERADMEMNIRAVPNSNKFTATASPHHGQAYGSLLLIDPRVPDDDALAPAKRITPEVDFPESQGGRQVYGTAWPLSENYYLCVYDAAMQKTEARQGREYVRGDYGIYLVDAFGNRELIYRDPEVGALDPMPLRPRTRPPVIPDKCDRLTDNPSDEGTMAVINVYDTMMPFPEGAEIKALRIYQIYPCSGPSAVNISPHQTGRRIAEASDSINLARSILGTVPVEADGSAYFTVPSLKEVYFQALDEDGLAVQSMRSTTWVQPGEKMVCYGCHEAKNRTIEMPQRTPIALRRQPSRPVPDVDGTRPFSYPRLVQPVLDRHCVTCHAEKANEGAMPLDKTVVEASLTNNAKQKETRVYRSYDSLVHKYAFWEYGDHYRTVPGKFGAQASKLYQILKGGHYDVNLSAEEMHRITVWLDSLSNFYGVYEKEGGEEQLRGEVVFPTLE